MRIPEAGVVARNGRGRQGIGVRNIAPNEAGTGLVISYSGNKPATEIPFPVVEESGVPVMGPKGTGIASFRRDDQDMVIKLDDRDGTEERITGFFPKDGKTPIKGEDYDDGAPGEPGVGIASASMSGTSLVIIKTDGSQVVLENFKPADSVVPGPPGIGVLSFALDGRDLVITRTDGSTQRLANFKPLDGVSPTLPFKPGMTVGIDITIGSISAAGNIRKTVAMPGITPGAVVSWSFDDGAAMPIQLSSGGGFCNEPGKAVIIINVSGLLGVLGLSVGSTRINATWSSK